MTLGSLQGGIVELCAARSGVEEELRPAVARHVGFHLEAELVRRAVFVLAAVGDAGGSFPDGVGVAPWAGEGPDVVHVLGG